MDCEAHEVGSGGDRRMTARGWVGNLPDLDRLGPWSLGRSTAVSEKMRPLLIGEAERGTSAIGTS
jgi:hypothetical protein